jgi:hypothetical protein
VTLLKRIETRPHTVPNVAGFSAIKDEIDGTKDPAKVKAPNQNVLDFKNPFFI